MREFSSNALTVLAIVLFFAFALTATAFKVSTSYDICTEAGQSPARCFFYSIAK